MLIKKKIVYYFFFLISLVDYVFLIMKTLI